MAILALVAVIEAAEKLAKSRLRSANGPVARRILGVLIFVLAVEVAP